MPPNYEERSRQSQIYGSLSAFSLWGTSLTESEEWYRRLMSATEEVGAPLAHLNHVSSNLGGTLRHAVDLFSFFTGSSRPFKSIFISALLAIALNEIAPSILQLVPSWYSIGPHKLSIPSLPPLSLHANLSTVFSRTSTTSSEFSTIYVFAALGDVTMPVKRYFPNAVVPLPITSLCRRRGPTQWLPEARAPRSGRRRLRSKGQSRWQGGGGAEGTRALTQLW
ncbi:hypothetical protein BT69DRAFT_1031267 [Atractiella rhizophila]|nr:hypothetical protein BT69DRAFT_1031267 [Atractiella rhizophila]